MHPSEIIYSVIEGKDDGEYVSDIMQAYAEAYHQSRLKEKGIIEFLDIILNSYKVINSTDDVINVQRSIVQKANDLRNNLLKTKQ